MEGMGAYQCFTALKLHFTTKNYDYIKYNGKTRLISEDSLRTRKDFYHFRRIERRYKDDLKEFIIANLVHNPNCKWVGDLVTPEADKIYAQWKRKMESLKYETKQELYKLAEEEDLLVAKSGRHPGLLKLYMGGHVSIETIIIMDSVLNFMPQWEKNITDTLVWPDIKLRIQKYKPFMKFEKNDMKLILKEVFT